MWLQNKQASLPVGARGFLISCLSGKEFQAGQEATRVLLTVRPDCRPLYFSTLQQSSFKALDWIWTTVCFSPLTLTVATGLCSIMKLRCPKWISLPAKAQSRTFSSLLASEVADLKDPKQRVLTYHKTNVSGLLFLSMLPNVPGPL